MKTEKNNEKLSQSLDELVNGLELNELKLKESPNILGGFFFHSVGHDVLGLAVLGASLYLAYRFHEPTKNAVNQVFSMPYKESNPAIKDITYNGELSNGEMEVKKATNGGLITNYF